MRVRKSRFIYKNLLVIRFTMFDIQYRQNIGLTTGSAGSPVESATLAHSDGWGLAKFGGGLPPYRTFAGRRPSRAGRHLTGWAPNRSEDSRPQLRLQLQNGMSNRLSCCGSTHLQKGSAMHFREELMLLIGSAVPVFCCPQTWSAVQSTYKEVLVRIRKCQDGLDRTRRQMMHQIQK